MKNIIGLDLGTNSIGWARIAVDDSEKVQPQIKLGSRIIPMSQDTLGKFDSGVTDSPTSARTSYRGTRRLRERCLLRRERLLRVLHVLNALPEHFDNSIGWNRNNNNTYGKFIDDSEPKISWRRNSAGQMEFVFFDSFNEMLNDFRKYQPQLLTDDHKVPFDWTLYYLRKKALTERVTLQELAWILLSFNQKRGYYQLRGEDEEESETLKKEEYYNLKVCTVEEVKDESGRVMLYTVTYENGLIDQRKSKTPITDWEGKKKEFIVTTEYNADGTIKQTKDGQPKQSFRYALKEDDWNLQKKRVETSIESSGKTVGEYIYDNLLAKPFEKIRGKLVRTVERKFYKDELIKILRTQLSFIPELTDRRLKEDCIRELYARNLSHQELLKKKDFIYLLVNDILFYQRPLKSKKSLISECPYEKYEYVDKNSGEVMQNPIKCIAKSNPFYQEFRLWQFVANLRFYNTEGTNDVDVTYDYLKDETEIERLFLFLNDRKEISQDTLLKDFLKLKKPRGKEANYPVRWNYIEEKSYPCNETRSIILSSLKKADIAPDLINDKAVEYRLWHLLYSVDDRNELVQALKSFAEHYHLPCSFVDAFKKIPSFKKEYGAYSEKAIKKLLSVMRVGSTWNEENIPDSADAMFKGTLDENIQSRISRYPRVLQSRADLKGLPEWLACYVVYGRHSESSDIQKWEKPEDLALFIKNFKQHSMRNPIVEQCVLETLRTVHDIWKECGHIDEIHVELGRSMKSTAEQRKRMNDRNLENENTNLRIKQLLLELKNDSQVQDVRPYSPIQQDILRIYEEGALQELRKDDADYEDIHKISRLATPTHSEITKYRLWLEQKYRSPYTGRTISLTKLFTPAYQIEHIIPQGRFFDDSLSNKVICEAEVNQLKSNMLGCEFIKKHGGEIVKCSLSGDVRVFSEEEYKNFVKEHYSSNRAKSAKLMMEDIPEEFIQRQMNDSRYISKVIKGMLSNIVRESDEVEAISKNVIPCTGGITDRLKKDWGLNDVWNHVVSPRFERMNMLTDSDAFGHWENKDGKRVFQTSIPFELQKGFSKKRIDHRHHAMDALVIALASRNIVSYLNNESARDTQQREDLRRMLCDKNRVIRKPWVTFTQDAENALKNIVVSFKHYIRVINKATNNYEHYDSNGRKALVKQKSADQWAVRKPMHKETVFGHVNLKLTHYVSLAKALNNVDAIVSKELKDVIKGMLKAGMDKKKINAHFKSQNYILNGETIAKISVYYYSDDVEPLVATRKALDDTFDEKKIMSITDTGIQKILLAYLKSKGNDPKIAFAPEGIVDMNENIATYNGGKKHQPIFKVRISEPMGEKYNIGERGINNKKFVEAQSGTNLYFAIYENDEGKRFYQTIPLNVVVNRLKLGYSPVPETNMDGIPLKFYLSPNDLVYVPTNDDAIIDGNRIDCQRIYRFVDSSGDTANFVPASSASVIYHLPKAAAAKYSNSESIIQDEYGVGSPQSKSQRAITGEMIKACCVPLYVDRLGNVSL